MKRLHKMVIMSFLGPFIMTFCIVLFILLIQFLWKYIDELVGKGLEVSIIAEILLYASSSLVPLALPLAVLLSSLMTFGSMGEFYELTAIKSSGISLRKVMMPVIVISVLISAGAFFFANNVLPVTNLKMKSLLWDVRQQRPEVQIEEGVFYNGIDNYSIRVSKRDPVKGMLYDIKIYDHSERRGNVKVTVADSGQMKVTADKRNLIITLWNGYAYWERNEDRRRSTRYYPHEMDKFREQRSIIQMHGFELLRSDESIFRNSYQMLNIRQLDRASDSIKREINYKSREFLKTLTTNSYFASRSLTSAGVYDSVTNINYSLGIAPPVLASPNNRFSTATAPATGTRSIAEDVSPISRPLRSSMPDTIDHGSPVVDTGFELQLPSKMKITNFDSLINSLSRQDLIAILNLTSSNTTLIQYNLDNIETTIDSEVKYLLRHEIEWHRKFTLSAACLIFLFIGAPLGAIIRKGGLGMPTVISTLLFILYYIISMTGEKFVRENVLTSFQGMWISSIILIITGIFLTYQATNDSAILSMDTYFTWIREKAGLKKIQILENKSHVTGRFELIDIPKEELQSEFKTVINNATQCIEKLQKDMKLRNLIKMTLTNKNLFYLVEFSVHFNSLFDQIILSKWFRDTYFQKRIGEFPYIHGRINSKFFNNKLFRVLAVIVFPIGILRLLQIRFLLANIKRNLKQITNLSSGMINLLNSSVLRVDFN